MRRALVLGVGGAVILVAAFPLGCGGGSGNTGGTGGTGGSSTATTSSHTSVTVTTTSTGTGGMMGNHSFDTAAPLDYGTPADGDLSPAGAVDYYSFQGMKGQAVDIYTYAQRQQQSAAFDPTWIDTIITLYDATKTQIAENNDSVPRVDNDSELITILPADGTYYVRVEECWSWAQSPSSVCAGTKTKDNTSYQVGVNLLDPTHPSVIADAETGNDAASATPLTYSKSSNGYYSDVIYGTYASATDVDVFKFTLPGDDIKAPAGTRPVVYFYPLPSTTQGNGSTTPVGKVSLVDPSTTPSTTVASFSGTDFSPLATPRLWPPIDPSKGYELWVEHPQGSLGAEDFYVFIHYGGYSNAMETSEAANDDPTTPEMPADAPDGNGGHHYYVDGDIISDTDKDHWAVPVTSGVGQITVSCASQRGGSGLRGFTVDVVDAADVTKVIATATETQTADLYTNYQSIPAGVTNMLVRMSTGQPHDATVTSSFYHCGIHLK